MATAIYQFPFPTQLKRLVDPTDPQDAATKSYVDNKSNGTYLLVVGRTGPLRVNFSGPGQFTVVGRAGPIVVPVQ